MRYLFVLFLGLETLSAESYRPLEHLGAGFRDYPSAENLFILGIGTALTIQAVASLNHPVQHYFQGHNRLSGIRRVGNTWGEWPLQVGVGVLALSSGLFFHNEKTLSFAEAHLEGQLVTAAFTQALKYSVRQERPTGTKKESFPSGHTSHAFATAATASTLATPWLSAPALALAFLTGVSRLAVNKHHLSDVLFGATLGWTVGYAYSRHHREEASSHHVTLLPYYEGRREFGVELTSSF